MNISKRIGISGGWTVSEETLRDNQQSRLLIGQRLDSMTKLRQRRWNEQRQASTIRYNQPRSRRKGQRRELMMKSRQRHWKEQRRVSKIGHNQPIIA